MPHTARDNRDQYIQHTYWLLQKFVPTSASATVDENNVRHAPSRNRFAPAIFVNSREEIHYMDLTIHTYLSNLTNRYFVKRLYKGYHSEVTRIIAKTFMRPHDRNRNKGRYRTEVSIFTVELND